MPPARASFVAFAIAAASFVSGCRGEAPVQGPRAVGSSSERASSGTSTAARPAPTSQPEPEALRFAPIRPITDPTELERLAFLKSVCDVGVQGAQADLDQRFGCTCCPPFSDCPPRPDGSLAENPDHVYGIEHVARGRFTRNDAEQELVTFHGCGVSMNGGSIAVFESNGGKRTTALYEDFMVVPARCEPYRLANGRDLAVCEAVSANQGHARVRIVAGDFAKAEGQRWRELAAFEDDSLPACSGEPGTPFVRNVVVRRGFADTNADRRLDLEIEIDTQRAVASRAFIERCTAWLEAGPSPPPSVPAPWDLLEGPLRKRLVFVHDGTSFVPTAATKRLLSK